MSSDSKRLDSEDREGHGKTILVTGATGYIGSRLVPRLLERGYRVRCLVRSPQKLQARTWSSHRDVEIVTASIEDVSAVQSALTGCDFAFYLIHSMVSAGSEYRQHDRKVAAIFAQAAESSGVKRIIYLGGLGETGDDLSEHLTSRREVEETLAQGSVPVTVLRAAMILGSGSASFEILRYLVERLPVMVTPRWVHTECQPIAVRDVLYYLVQCLEVEQTTGRVIDIGGPETVTYQVLIRELARARGLTPRLVIPVPVLTPKLSSLWIHLVTPLSHRIARPLAEGLRNRVVCRNDDATRLMPHRLLGIADAIDHALGRTDRGQVESAWSDAGPMPGDPDWAGGTVFVDRRSIEIEANPRDVFRAVCRVGGGHGWYKADWLWKLRGFLDRLIGGPGLRRGRRDPETVSFGDALDFWRVTGLEVDRRLELRAEMKLPGEASLELEIDRRAEGSLLTQTARFKPRGIAGLAYWFAVLPLHGYVFRGMLNGMKQAAEALSRSSDGWPWRLAEVQAPKQRGTAPTVRGSRSSPMCGGEGGVAGRAPSPRPTSR